MADVKFPRILIVGPKAPPLGGMAIQGQALVAALDGDGASVRFVATNPDLGPLARVPVLRGLVSLPYYLLLLLGAIPRVEVVHVLANSWLYFFIRVAPALWLGRAFGRRVVLNYHGGQAEAFFAKHPRAVRRIARWAHAITVPSAFLERVFAAHRLTVTRVPNVVDLGPLVAPLRASGVGPKLLVCRNLEPIYAVETAIGAFERVALAWPQASLTIAGVGSERTRLEALVATLPAKDRIRFVGKVPASEMPGLYASHDIMLNPTTADNQPLTLIEGLACGIAIVSTDAGGIPDLVQHEREVLLVPVGDAGAMSDAVLRLRSDPALVLALRARGAELVQQFAWSKVRTALFASYGLDAFQRQSL